MPRIQTLVLKNDLNLEPRFQASFLLYVTLLLLLKRGEIVMFNTEIVAKDIDGIKMQLRKAYDGDVPEGLAVFYWLKNNGIGIRDRNGEVVRDDDLYSFCINYGASVDRAIVAAKSEGASDAGDRVYREQ